MSDLLSLITPHTRSLIWLSQGEVSSTHPLYKEVDYLLNGLLTATLKSPHTPTGQVLVGESFGSPFYVFLTREISDKEAKSFFELVKPELDGEKLVLVIDETNQLQQLQKIAPAELRSKFLLFK